MIRLSLILALTLGASFGPAAAQTAIGERPGRWVSAAPRVVIPQAEPETTAGGASGRLIAPTEPAIGQVIGPEGNPASPTDVIASEAPDVALEVVDVLAPAIVLAPLADPEAGLVPTGARPVPRPIAAIPADPGGDLSGSVEPALAPEQVADAVAPVIAAARAEPQPPLVLARVPVSAMPVTARPAAMAAVMLPDTPATPRPLLQPASVAIPRHDLAPVLSRPLPPAPAAQDRMIALDPAPQAPLSAVLLPGATAPITRQPRLYRAAAPRHDPFPSSALSPDALPEGPDSLDRSPQPSPPEMEPMASVLLSPPMAAPARPAPLPAPPLPGRDPAPTDPEAPIVLPAPDPLAIARMIDDAQICWSMARLSPEARWAVLSVDVSLDETNMPAARSIRLTGFGRVLSGAAEDAFRAAEGALTGCAAATAAEPATTSTTLVFDRDGVRLR